MKPQTPYSQQPNKSFWKTGVANTRLRAEQFTELHQIDLNQTNPNIASVGSCFAQHVGKWLIKKGYSFKQSQIETQQTASFAFGNIYTPRCFLQWLDIEATNQHQHSIHKENQHYFDLLRPSFRPKGFDSEQSLINARIAASKELTDSLKNTDILIFTLGLTEAWQDKNGIFYPSCPGVIAGEFNPDIHSFHNFNYTEIKQDLETIAKQLKNINPQIKLILTVSPVPLTATATDKHILVANQYSKSVLRAVAGNLTDNNPHFSYFPSYEIITVANGQDFRFNANLRSVSTEAVDYVMQHFETVLHSSPKKPPNPTTISDEVQCDEEKLETIRNTLHSPTNHNTTTHKLTLLGDSHMSKLSTALKKQNIPHCGGMVMNGSGFTDKKFALCPDEYFVPLESADSRKLWSLILKNLQHHENNNNTQNSTIITNIGLQTHRNAAAFINWHNQQEDKDVKTNLLKYLSTIQGEQLNIIYKLHQAGHKVIVVSDPPFSQFFTESKGLATVIYSYFNATEYLWQQHGVQFYNAAAAFNAEISDPSPYSCSEAFADGGHDWYHGNKKYYEWLAQKILKLVKI